MLDATLERKDFTVEEISNKSEDELFYFVKNDSIAAEKITAPRYSYWKSVARIFFKRKSNWVMLILLTFILFMSYIYPLFVTYNEMENVMKPMYYNLSPSEAIATFGFSFKWILGTGGIGNSIFYGIWYGARTSVSLSFICAAINMTIGVLIGAAWGYNKTLDAVMTVVHNIVADIPYILLVSVLVYVVGSGFGPFVFALTITGWLGIAYFFRTQVLIIRDREYNLASRCLGTRLPRVVGHNIMPFLTSVIMTILATELPGYISYEVYLSYIGVGLSAAEPSLGRMIESAQSAFKTFPWSFWSPVAIASSLTIILYIIGQNLADASDPRTHM